MNTTLQLIATLADDLPPAIRSTDMPELDVAPYAGIGQVIAPLALPGTMLQPVLAIWPPVAGG